MRATTILVAGAALTAMPFAAANAIGETWASLPTPEEVQAAYPRRDDGENYSGAARLRCAVAPDGALEGCAVTEESPKRRGFGRAAEVLIPKFRVATEAVGRFPDGVAVKVEFDALSPRRPLRGLVYKSAGRFARLGPPGPYWPDRAQRMGVSGVALLDCHTEGDSLVDCSVADVAPRDWAFELAALKMAEHGYVTAGQLPEGMSPPADGIWRFRFEFRHPRDR